MDKLKWGDAIETKFIAQVILLPSMLFAVFFLALGEIGLFYQTFSPITCLLAVIILDHYHYRKTSKIFLIYSLSASLVYFTHLTSKESSIHLLFIVVAILPLIIFKVEESWSKWTSVIATVLFYFFLEYTLIFTNSVISLPKETLNYISIFSMITIILINLAIIQAFSNAKRRYEDNLVSLNNTLEVYNKNLLEANQKLKESQEIRKN